MKLLRTSFFAFGCLALPAAAAENYVPLPGHVRETVPIKEVLELDGLTTVQQRTVINMPPELGKLITITSGGQGVVFWFENEKGHIRNVTLNPSESLLIRRAGKLRIDGQGL